MNESRIVFPHRLARQVASLLFPVLVAIHAPISLLAANRTEAAPAEALRAIWTLALLGLAIGGLLSLVLRDLPKGGLAAGVVLLVALSYGQLYTVLKTAHLFGVLIGRHRFLVPLAGGLIVATLVVLKRHRGDLGRTTAAMSAAMAVVVAATGAPVVAYTVSAAPSIAAPPSATSPGVAPPGAPPSSLPDIYYIILDAHGRSDALEALYGIDSSGFLDGLRRLGFYVADRSMSNYSQTELSLASSLNMMYLTELADTMGAASDDRRPVQHLMNDSQVIRLARSLGYKIVVYESAVGFVDLTGADATLAPTFEENRQGFALLSGLSLTPFEGILLETSIGRILFDLQVQRQDRLTPIYSDFNFQKHRVRILFQFESLPGIAGDDSPTFAFVHVMAPHPPFVFTERGEEVPHREAFSLQDVGCCSKDEYVAGYRAQVIYIDKLLELAVSRILAASPEPPIIVVQGDHGPGANLDWRAPTPLGRLERMTILNAYYLPDRCRDRLYSEITPVNTFRVVFGACLDGDYPLLADQSLFSTYWRPYDTENVENGGFEP